MNIDTNVRSVLDRDWHWPRKDKGAWMYLTNPKHLYFPFEIKTLCSRFSKVIQAGGHCGLYGYQYSQFFDNVYTFEPDTKNHFCLTKNLSEFSNVEIFNFGLGDKEELVSLNANVKNSGGISVDQNTPGTIPIKRIDDLNLDCDLIHLDLEGFELFALKGSIETIKRCKPVIVVETNESSDNYGYTKQDLIDYIISLGYKVVKEWEDDVAFSPL